MELYQLAEIAKLQREDPDLALLIQWLENSDPVQAELYLQSPSTKYLWKFKNQLRIINGILNYNWQSKIDRRICLVVPSSLKKGVAGHFVLEKALSRLESSFFWYQMKTDCDIYIKNCRVCNIHKKHNYTARSPLKRYHASYPMERVHLDVSGPFTQSKSGNKYVLMMIDQFSKWVECSAIPEQSTETVVQEFLTCFVATFR